MQKAASLRRALGEITVIVFDALLAFRLHSQGLEAMNGISSNILRILGETSATLQENSSPVASEAHDGT